MGICLAFRFNAEGAILGVLEPTDNDGTQLLPFKDFLATRYLRVGRWDQPIHKFTGNTDCGDPPRDALTTTIHAFTHYTIVFTAETMVLCDLQAGMFDRKKCMVLIDPQCHS
ncbi:hypothetical protein B0H10DRAFT_1817039 [Mycena sp. CBHHK59/15]|nr:hypothetical protein B0H10DRAFT_1817039 [Mycena sp. CBHHK59/15]